MMKNIVVIGAQWGDEGKGKVVDILAPYFSVVARYQGGHNAGHTVRIGDLKFVLHLIPSGILHPDCICVIGNGTVVAPEALRAEIDQLNQNGIDCRERLFISSRAHLILPYHTAIERAREKELGVNGVGTTMRGIGPAYEHKAARVGIRAGDLLFPDLVRERIIENTRNANRELVSLGAESLPPEKSADEFLAEAAIIKDFVRDTAVMLNEVVSSGGSVLLEGAQGTLLDVDHGTYPYVTSSNATAGGAAIGTGLSPKLVTGTLGITKAYTTRVGGGPFPTELRDETGKYLIKRGNEYGASTGRERRTGWFDAVVVKYSTMLNQFDALALPKLDVLDEFEEIKICAAYRWKDQVITDFPHSSFVLEECEPIYESHQGWKQATTGITEFDELPAAAKEYIHRIEQLCGAPVALISTGPERNETIIRRDSAVAAWMTPPT